MDHDIFDDLVMQMEVLECGLEVIIIGLEVEAELLEGNGSVSSDNTVGEFDETGEDRSIIDLGVLPGEISESEGEVLDLFQPLVYSNRSSIMELVVAYGVLDVECIERVLGCIGEVGIADEHALVTCDIDRAIASSIINYIASVITKDLLELGSFCEI